MRILIAMCCMQFRTGAELFVRDIALTLHQRGHTIAVYSPFMGDMVDELRAVCIACVTDLTQLAEAPDIIIGNTRDETVACMARFLGVPAMSICHDRTAAHGRPPLFGRIRQYIAVDENCAERLYLEHGIARSAVQIVSNGVDLARFTPRGPLPEKPLRAAIFSNYSTEHQDTATIRAVCQQHSIALDVIGTGVGRQSRSPEAVLAHYDLVFAKARCALEAMAIGCAVILFNENMGMAGMVTTGNVSEWQPWNFGRRLLQVEVSPANVSAAIADYSATDAHAVSSHVRMHLSLDATCTQLESIAKRIVAEEATRTPISASVEISEFARHCTDNLHPHGVAYEAAHAGLMQASITTSEAIILQQQGQLANLNQQLELREREMRETLLQQQERLASLNRQHESRETEVREACSQEQVHIINKLYERERHVQALLSSKSWRVTAPLRWLATWLGMK